MSDEWILSISHLIPQSFYLLDIRRIISYELQFLASLCRLSQVAVTNTLEIIGSNQFFTPTMLSRNTLDTQVNIIVNEAINDIIAEQNQVRQLIQTFNHQNQLVSALGTTYLYQTYNSTTELLYFVE